jgi:uncharacterized membrane protein YfcA
VDPGLLRDGLTLALGVLTGALSGLFGVGGAVISTPGIRALGASAVVAVGTTLPSIIPGASSGALRYWREQLIDRRTVAWAAPAGVVASVAGSLLSNVVPGDGHLLMLLTAALLGWSAWRTYRSSRPVAGEPGAEAETDDLAGDPPPGSGAEPVGAADLATSETVPFEAAPVRLVAVGTLAGLLSGLLGVGGGIVMVPGFTHFARMPLKRAIATSLACVALFAVPGTITHAVFGEVDWRFALILALGVVPGARIGAGLTVRADDARLRVVVALFLGFTAVLYGAGELLALTR